MNITKVFVFIKYMQIYYRDANNIMQSIVFCYDYFMFKTLSFVCILVIYVLHLCLCVFNEYFSLFHTRVLLHNCNISESSRSPYLIESPESFTLLAAYNLLCCLSCIESLLCFVSLTVAWYVAFAMEFQ